VILVDTTVLSNFAHIGRPDLLRLALPNAATTPQVLVELERGRTSGHLPDCDWNWLEIVALSPAEEAHLNRIRRFLGSGEASCIAVALERGGILFTDDLDARRYAVRCGLSVSGTLGVLALLVRDGHLGVQEADLYLERMRAAGYRSPVKSVTEIPGFPSG